MTKTIAIVGLSTFIALHVIVFGGAAAYGLHLVGIDIGWLDHHHGVPFCHTPKG